MPDLLARVADVCARVAHYALERQAKDFRRWHKPGGSPVCEVDLSVNKRLRAALCELDPEAGWLSEESEDDPARVGRQRAWVVDPLDGTRDYVRGRTVGRSPSRSSRTARRCWACWPRPRAASCGRRGRARGRGGTANA